MVSVVMSKPHSRFHDIEAVLVTPKSVSSSHADPERYPGELELGSAVAPMSSPCGISRLVCELVAVKGAFEKVPQMRAFAFN